MVAAAGRGADRPAVAGAAAEGQGGRERRESDLKENVIHINRVAKVVKGGRRFSFTALVAVGDQQGKVGTGTGKANEVSEAVRKALESARRAMVSCRWSTGRSRTRSSARPAPARCSSAPRRGTGVIAGGAVRAVLECAGVHNILTKSLGSTTRSTWSMRRWTD
jgi:small subunit ribosomal protein S5